MSSLKPLPKNGEDIFCWQRQTGGYGCNSLKIIRLQSQIIRIGFRNGCCTDQEEAVVELIKDIVSLLSSAGVVWFGAEAIVKKSGFGCSGYEAVILGLVFAVCGGVLFHAIVCRLVKEYSEKNR